MNLEQLKNAGFSDQEISQYVHDKTAKLKSAGFGEREIGEYFGRQETKKVSAVKEIPENLAIGMLNLGAGAANAVKKRAIQASGAAVTGGDIGMFEAVEPTGDYEVKKVPGLDASRRVLKKDKPFLNTYTGILTSDQPYSPNPFDDPLNPEKPSMAAEAIGTVSRLPDVAAKALTAKAQDMQAKQGEVTFGKNPVAKTSRLVFQSGVPSIAVAVGTSLLTGNPAVGLATLGEIEGGSSFQSQLDAGAGIGQATVISELSEAAEIGGEMLVFPKLFKGLKKGIPLKEGVQIVAENAGQEGVTGFVQRFLEVFGSARAGGESVQDAVNTGFNQGLKAIPENALVGGVTAGGAAAVSKGTSKLVGSKNKNQMVNKAIAKVIEDNKVDSEKTQQEQEVPTQQQTEQPDERTETAQPVEQQENRKEKVKVLQEKIAEIEAETDADGSGISPKRRQQMINQVKDVIKNHPAYKSVLDNFDYTSDKTIGRGKYYVDPVNKGDVLDITGKPGSSGFNRALYNSFTFDPKSRAIPWDAAARYADIEVDDIHDFVNRVQDAINSEQTESGFNTKAMEVFENLNDPYAEFYVEKLRMLENGESSEKIDDFVNKFAEFHNIDPADMATEYAGVEPLKISQIKQLDDPKAKMAAIEALAKKRVIERQRKQAQTAAGEVLAANGLEAAIEIVDEIQAEGGDDLPFEMRGKRALGAAIITDAGEQIIKLAYGADSRTGYHEGYHILRGRLEKRDARVLDRFFADEEAEARAFADYAVKGNPPKGIVKQIFDRMMKALKRVKSALVGKGYRQVEDIFADIQTGKIKKTDLTNKKTELGGAWRFQLDKQDKNGNNTDMAKNKAARNNIAPQTEAETGTGATKKTDATGIDGLSQEEIVSKPLGPKQPSSLTSSPETIGNSQYKVKPEKSQEKKTIREWMYDFANAAGDSSNKSEAVYFDGPGEIRLRVAAHEAVYDSSAEALNVAFKGRGDQDADIVLEDENITAAEFGQILQKWYDVNEEHEQEMYDEPLSYETFEEWIDSNYKNLIRNKGQYNTDLIFPFIKHNQSFNNPAPEDGGRTDTLYQSGQVKENNDIKYELGERVDEDALKAEIDKINKKVGFNVSRAKMNVKIDEKATPYLPGELTEVLDEERILRDFDRIKAKELGLTSSEMTKADNRRAQEFVARERQKKYNKLDDSWYEANSGKIKRSVLAEGKNLASKLWLGAEKTLSAVSTRLKNISPEIFRRVREYSYKVNMRSAAMLKDITPFLKKIKKLPPPVQRQLDLAMKNADGRKIEQIIKKYSMETEYAAVRETLDQIYQMGNAVGMEIKYHKDYFHRFIKDPKGFLEYTKQFGDDWSVIDQAIKKLEKQRNRNLTEDEKAKVANSLLRGYRVAGLTLSRPGAAKQRSVEIVDQQLNRFYHNSFKSLVDYVREMNEKIAAREFFGRETKELVNLRANESRLLTRMVKLGGKIGYNKPGEEISGYNDHISGIFEQLTEVRRKIDQLQNREMRETIGGHVMGLVAEEAILPSQENMVRDMFEAIFDPRGMSGIVGLSAQGGYITTLGSPLNTLTQLKEYGLAFYRSPVRFVPAAVRSVLKRSKINVEDIGITDAGVEFTAGNMGKLANRVFKITGFELVDRLGKETYINTVIGKYRGMAKRNDKSSGLYRKVNKVFGGETQKVINELKSGQLTDNVKLLAFNELADIQPVAITEMPEYYAKGGNGRIFYMLKSFTLRQIDFVRNEIFTDLKRPKTAARGLAKLVWLAFSLSLFGAGVDALKDLIRGRKFDLADSVVNNLLQYAMLSKYNIYKLQRDGVRATAVDTAAPPLKTVDAIFRDAQKRRYPWEGETIRSVPIVGEIYYWWFGRGKEKNEQKKKKKGTLF